MSFCVAETVSGSSGGRPGARPRFRATAIPSRVRSEISRRSRCAIAPKTWNTSSAADEEVSRRSSTTDQVDPTRLEVVSGFEQLAQRASQPVEPDHAQAVSRSGVVDQLREAGPIRALSRCDVGEDTQRARFEQTVSLRGEVPVGSRDAGVAEGVAGTCRCGRLNIEPKDQLIAPLDTAAPERVFRVSFSHPTWMNASTNAEGGLIRWGSSLSSEPMPRGRCWRSVFAMRSTAAARSRSPRCAVTTCARNSTLIHQHRDPLTTVEPPHHEVHAAPFFYHLCSE